MLHIRSQQALRGPNYWSHDYPKLILTRLELVGAESLAPAQEQALLAFIRSHFPAEVTTDLSQAAPEAWVVWLALSLQKAVGCEVGYHEFRPTAYPGISNLVVEYVWEEVGKRAVDLAVGLFNRADNLSLVDFENAGRELLSVLQKTLPPAQIQEWLHFAKTQQLPIFEGEQAGVYQLGYGCKSVAVTEKTTLADIQMELVQNKIGRIPILAVTGSNGKTTTTRLLAHILRGSGQSVGFTTSDGIYINQEMIDSGDTTGPASAQMVLADPRVEVAVLETARGGIVRAGLGFDRCNLAVVTNVQADHLGISDIETLDQLARVKEVIVKAVQPEGWAVLNAANTYTLAMGQTAPCQTAWFAKEATHPQLQLAISQGQPVAYVEQAQIVVQVGPHKINMAPLSHVPITFNGTLGFMVENALAATLAAFVYGVPAEIIRPALASFYPSVAQTPGRMNIFELRGSTLLVDFAHNPDGFAGIADFLSHVQSPFKIGIIVGTGDRLDEDTRALGRLSAQMFDLTLIHQVKFLRGRTADYITDMLVEGIHNHNPQSAWLRIPDEAEPLAFALQLAKPGSFITALSDVLTDVPLLVAKYGQ